MDAERDLVAALRSRDEAVFAEVVTAWSGSMLALARGFVSTQASAEEVVQDTWLAVVRGIDAFEGRSGVRTWVYRILVNTAKTRGVRERRMLPWSSLGVARVDGGEEQLGPLLDPGLFRSAGDPHPGHWWVAPAPWPEHLGAEGAVLASEVRRELGRVVDALPERQRVVLTMRDVLGHGSEEVCAILGISRSNQRVLLHRARTAVRAGLAEFLTGRDDDADA